MTGTPAGVVNPRPAPAASADLTADNYRFLQQYVYKESGIVLDDGKQYLIEARLLPLVRQQSMASLNDLCALLRANGHHDVRRRVVESMTTNETLFFRDPAQYAALRETIIPALVQQRSLTRTMSFWSAASSSGQEAYSLAMMLREMGLGDWSLNIVGTDLADSILDRARAGRFMQIEVNRGLPAPMLIKYFTRVGLDWQLKDEIRRMVRFERFDLRESMRMMGPFDVVFCRNVLIYFDLETRRQILREVRGALTRGGYLLLGGAETTFNVDDQFIRRMMGQAVLYQAP
jgi:chemotaxis protein methyltransferase CheR